LNSFKFSKNVRLSTKTTYLPKQVLVYSRFSKKLIENKV
jgi:hypothetical protein